MNKSTMPLYTCLVIAVPGGYEAVWGPYRATGETEEQATRALRSKLVVVPRTKNADEGG